MRAGYAPNRRPDTRSLQADAQADCSVPAANSAPPHVGRACQHMRLMRSKQSITNFFNHNFVKRRWYNDTPLTQDLWTSCLDTVLTCLGRAF